MEALKPILRYWSLTAAVFTFYLFAILIALVDAFNEMREAARKKRAAAKTSALEPNPLAGRTIAQTVFPGPGQQLDAKREWVARLAADIIKHVSPNVKILVLEDSKGHPLVHFSDGLRLESYRVDRTLVEQAMAGDQARVAEVKDFLTRHLIADFLGTESVRPPRTTELAREAAPKAAAAPATPTAPASSPAPAPAAPAPAAQPSAPPADTEGMSREERLAAARARAEALRKQRTGESDKPSS